MKVLGKELLRDFAKRHAAARKPIQRFVEIVESAQWKHLPDVKRTFSATDLQRLIFDIGGNNYRLMASVDFVEQIFLVEAMLTHSQYDKENR